MSLNNHLIQAFLEEIQRLRVELKTLYFALSQSQRQLGLDSSNSSKPPSSDGLRKPPAEKRTQSTRQKGSKASGGHKGSTLKQVNNPDKVVRHTLDQCPNCSESLGSIATECMHKRQVFDIPKPRILVTEHQSEVKRCPCCTRKVSAAFPDSINCPTQYGEGIQALTVYFLNQQLIPEDRVQMLFEDLFKLRISTATLVNMGKQFSQTVVPIQALVLEKLKKVGVKHLDETGFRIGGKTNWLHVISNPLGTHYRTSAKRKNLLEALNGIVIHDHYKPYFSIKDVRHGLCNAHHLRELKAISEIDKELWAWKMSRLLRIVGRLSKGEVKSKLIKRIEKIYARIVTQSLKYYEKLPPLKKTGTRGPPKRRDGHNLGLRLRKFKIETLRCLKNPAVPFTNNQAEQDIRMMKVKQKISGGFRTEKGAKIFCNVRGFLSTCRKQRFNIFASITQTLLGIPPEFSFS